MIFFSYEYCFIFQSDYNSTYIDRGWIHTPSFWNEIDNPLASNIQVAQSESWHLSYWRKFSDFSETVVNRPSLRVPPMLSPLKLILIFLPRSLLAEKLDVASLRMYSEKFLILISILAQVTSQFSIILFSCLTKKKVIMNYYHVNPTTESDSCSDEESCRGSNLPHSSTLINPTRKRRRGIIGKFFLSM